MKKLLMGAVAVMLLLATGCYFTPIQPPPGIVYSDFTAPLSVTAQEEPAMLKSGSAESMSILGLVALGDCSVGAAAEDGGLSNVKYADYHFYNVLGVYQLFTVNAYGD